MSGLKDSIRQLANADRETLRRWVRRLYKYKHDGLFSGELIHQFEDPSTAFQVVYDDAENCELETDDLERFRDELRLSVALTLADCAKHDRHDPFVLGELVNSVGRHGVRRALSALCTLSQSKEMIVQRHHGQRIQALLLEALASLYDTTPDNESQEESAAREHFNRAIVGLLLEHGRDVRLAATCLQGMIPIDSEIAWVCLPPAIVSIVLNGDGYRQPKHNHPASRFLAQTSSQSYSKHFRDSATKIMKLSGNISFERRVNRLVGLGLPGVLTPFEFFLYLTREYCSEVDLVRMSDVGIDMCIKPDFCTGGDRVQPDSLFRLRARNSCDPWMTIEVPLTEDEISCAVRVRHKRVGQNIRDLWNPGWLRDGVNRLPADNRK